MSQTSHRIARECAPWGLFLLLGVLLFPSAGTDDVYLTYWASHTLSEYGEIVNYNGDRVEQSSSILHVIILAVLHALLRLDIVVLGKLFSVLMGVANIYLAGRLAEEFSVSKTLCRLLVATTSLFLYWSFGGLEATAVGAALTLIAVSLIRLQRSHSTKRFLVSCAGVAAYVTLRPEGIFVLGLWLALVAAIIRLQKRSARSVIVIAGVGALSFVLLTLFRYSYFGAYFPQPVTAKFGYDLIDKLKWGLDTYYWTLVQYPIFAALALAPLYLAVVHRKECVARDKYVILISLAFSYMLFVLASGGDWMEGGRFFVPIIPVLVVMLLDVLSRLGRPRLALVLVPLNVLAVFYFSAYFSGSIPMHKYTDYKRSLDVADRFSFFETANKWHYVKLPVVVELDRIVSKAASAGVSPVIMSIESGIVPFHLGKSHFGEFRFIDLVGISTRDLTDCELSANAPRRQWGMDIGYAFFLRAAEQFKDRCGIDKPDIIYDIIYDRGDRAEKPPIVMEIESYGYHAVYIQERLIEETWRFVEQPHYIMIRDELAEKLGMLTTRYRN